MTRQRLPDRRHSVTVKIPFTTDGGKAWSLLVTIGREAPGLPPREVFCADFKAGTTMHAVVTDSCILLSRLLQAGVTCEEIAASLCEPPSLIGTLTRAVVADQEKEKEG